MISDAPPSFNVMVSLGQRATLTDTPFAVQLRDIVRQEDGRLAADVTVSDGDLQEFVRLSPQEESRLGDVALKLTGITPADAQLRVGIY